MADEFLKKRRNPKTEKIYALVYNSTSHDYAVFIEQSNYDGKVRGGIRKTWRYVGKSNHLTIEDAVKLFNKRAGWAKAKDLKIVVE